MIIVLVFALLLLATAVFIVVRYALLAPGRTEATLQQIRAYGFRAAESAQVEPRQTIGDVAARIGRRIRGTRFALTEEQMRSLLMQAGMYGTGADRLLGYQVFGAVGGGVFLLWLASAAGLSPVLIALFTILGIVIGWLLPVAYVKRRIRLRHERIEYELPDLIDLLVVSLEAGLSFPASLRVAADRLKGPLGQELRLTLQEQNMGLSIEDALANLQRRADTGGMSVFTRSVIQGQRLGVSMGHIMRNIAEEMRKRRKATAEERAQKAPIKMLFPLVFLIFPALFVVILLPAIIAIARGLG